MWILIYTKANEEKRAENNLKQQGFETLPLILPKTRIPILLKLWFPYFPDTYLLICI